MALLPLFVTPAIFKPGSMVFKNQRRSKNVDSRLKISGMTREVDASLNFRHDKKRSPRRERVGREWFLPFYKANYMGLKTRDRHRL